MKIVEIKLGRRSALLHTGYQWIAYLPDQYHILETEYSGVVDIRLPGGRSAQLDWVPLPQNAGMLSIFNSQRYDLSLFPFEAATQAKLHKIAQVAGVTVESLKRVLNEQSSELGVPFPTLLNQQYDTACKIQD